MRRWCYAMAIAAVALASAKAAPIVYKAPPETARLAPGPDSDVAQAYCGACHSVDYITTQPRKLAQPTTFWTNEVNKMKKAYGAQISDDDSQKIIAYLVKTYTVQ